MKIDNTKIREISEDLLRKSSSPSRLSIFNENRSEITYLSVGQLHPYQKQARRIFDQEDIDALAETIKEHGIRQPLTVLRVSSDPVHFEVISGERRLRAAKNIGLQKVPCIIIDNVEKAEEIALVENIQRQDLHPLEIANALNALVSKIGWGGQAVLQKKLGITKSTISELLKLLELPISVRDEMLRTNFRGRDVTRKLLSLKSEQKQLEFMASMNSRGPSDPKKKLPIISSVLRISLNEERLMVQKTGLARLTVEQKQAVKELLMDVVKDLQ
ncbi:ParB/RepB/Spo0J family partition protein [Candidatus Paracaedibacter symbiosus]|uniref:ParB/RepB/Spo0J family partition protein n=1 Tax=Candidatus Paracaedibacter symbiosus TaxID=244582 RepID=UPI00068D4420|nr:ParB/RepB/Spo0J family partition protein [Candidatus Paracaedibacter symbiosus]